MKSLVVVTPPSIYHNGAHFSIYDLDGNFDHKHLGTCDHFTIMATLFDVSFSSFINAIVLNQISDDKL